MATRFQRWITAIWKSERGQDMVEYALITVVISVAIVLATIGILNGAFETWAKDLKACITAVSPDAVSCPF